MSMQWAILLIVLIFSWSQATVADNLLRLFTTAQQRTELNKERSKPLPGSSPAGTPPGPIQLKPPSSITFNGLVMRSQGPTTIWINDDTGLIQQGFSVEIQKRTGLSVPLKLSNQQTILLKPGQTVDTLTGEVKENFEQPSTILEPQP